MTDKETLRLLVHRLNANVAEINAKYKELLHVCLKELKSPYPTKNRKDLVEALENYLKGGADNGL
jgi:hypothetical protein